MKAFILAAGFGERLRPLTGTTPKPLLPVLNLPVICYTLSLLKEAGIRDVVINLHHEADQIIRFFDAHDRFRLNVTFSCEAEILGTGGGLKRCQRFLEDAPFFLINSDIVLDADLSGLAEMHARSGAPATLLLHRTQRAAQIGPVGVSGNHVVDFNNLLGTGVTSDLIYSGAAVISPDIFPCLEGNFSSIVTTGYTGLIRDRFVGFSEHRGFWCDVGNPSAFLDVNTTCIGSVLKLRERIRTTLGMEPACISPSARIGSDAVLCDSVVGEACSVGEHVRFQRVVVLPKSSVPDRSALSDAVVHPGGVLHVQNPSTNGGSK